MENKTTAKKDKPIMRLYEYHKRRFLFWITVLIAYIGMMISEHLGVDDKLWFIVVAVIFAVIGVVLVIRYINCFVGYEVDKDDEFSKENIAKAHESILGVYMFLFAIVMLVSIFWKGEFTIAVNKSFIMYVYFIFYSFYICLESGLFMFFEGKISADTEDE